MFSALCLRPLGVCGRAGLFLLPLLLLAVGVLYVRIMYSPVAIDFLAAPIERALNAGLADMSVGIEGAVLHRSERGGVELRLRKLRLRDANDHVIADATWAGVEVSMRALMSARVAPTRIELIEPRIVLSSDEQGRLRVSLGEREGERAPAGGARHQPGEARSMPPPAAAQASQLPPAAAPPIAGGAPPSLEPGRFLVEVMERLRRTGDGSDLLRTIGVRDAIVVVEDGSRRATWHVPSFHAELRQKLRHQSIAGTLKIAGPDAPWAVGFRVEPAEGGVAGGLRPLRIVGDVAGFVPAALAGVPALAMLDGVDVPVTATGVVDIAGDGALVGWRATADLGQGSLLPSGAGGRLQKGRVEVRFDAAGRRLELLPSPLELDDLRLTLAGHAAPMPDGRWRFDIAARDAAIAGATRTAPPIPVEQLAVKGAAGATPGVEIEAIVARIAGVDLTASGRIGGEGGTDLTASSGPVPVASLRALLPRCLLPACDAALERLAKGTVTARAVRLARSPLPERNGALDLSLTIEVQDLELELARGLPPLEAPRALLRLDGNVLELAIPEAHVAAGNRRILLRGGRAVVSGLGSTTPTAEITLRTQGPLPAFLDLADREPLRPFKGAGPPHPAVDGKVDGQLKLTFPLVPEPRLADLKIEGRARITEGRIKEAVGPHDVSGVTLAIEGSEQSVDLKGKLVLAGVVVEVTGGWQPGAGGERRLPSLEFTTRLDSAYRNQLGLDLEHMLAGDVPVRVLLRDMGGEPKAHFIADLTPAEVMLADINWRKPAGRAAKLEFDVAKGQVPKTLELQNFKLVGENVAIEGWVGVGPDNKAREYNFPEFSINVITNLAVRGKLRPDRVWEVVARGKTYDARDLFRSFYHFGGEAQPVPKNRPGVDLDAEIDTVVGMNDSTLRRVRMTLRQRAEKLTALELTGVLEGGQPFSASMRPRPGGQRVLTATTRDAGQTLKLIGFYSSLVGGTGELTVNLEGRGPVEKSGEVQIRNFYVLGDPIVAEVLQNADGSRPAIEQGTTRRRVVREQFDFDNLTASVAVGNGQLALEHVVAEGPLIGASLRGKIDFRSRRMQLGGTYVPLSGLNRALSGVPLINFLLTGPRGEGIFGITFSVEGPMSQPTVLVNPLSLVTPGLLRELFQMAPDNPRITPKAEPKPVRGGGPQLRSSPPTGEGAQGQGAPGQGSPGQTGASGQAGAQGPAPAARQPQSPPPQRGEPDLLDGWSATAKRK